MFVFFQGISTGSLARPKWMKGIQKPLRSSAQASQETNWTQLFSTHPLATLTSLEEPSTIQVPPIMSKPESCCFLVTLVPYFIVFFNLRYYRFNEKSRTVDPDYPKPISVWTGVPDNIKGAIMSEDGGTGTFELHFTFCQM